MRFFLVISSILSLKITDTRINIINVDNNELGEDIIIPFKNSPLSLNVPFNRIEQSIIKLKLCTIFFIFSFLKQKLIAKSGIEILQTITIKIFEAEKV